MSKSHITAVRCSSLPLAFRCPGAIRSDTGVMIDLHHDAADVGSDVHRLLASHPEGDAPAALLGELPDDARILYFTGAKLWREQIAAWMPDSESEVEYFDDEGSGHVDRQSISADGARGVVLDWKTGRKDSDYRHQGFGYARRLFLAHRLLDVVTVHFCWLRTQELESYTVSRERAEEWECERHARVVDWDGVYHPGEHCSDCRRFASCPAHAEMNRASLALVQAGTVNLATMDGPTLATTLRRLGPLAKTIEQLQDACKAEVRARGEVDDGAGRVLHFVETNGPREVDTLKAWDALSSRLTDKELAACLKVKLGDVEQAVAAKAGRGKGAEAKRQLAAALEAAGAITQPKVDRFKDERKE